jgi:hypothetical protein
MDAKTLTNDVKNEVSKGIEKLTMLRDEVKLHIHLASLDAKQEWNDKLEPRINEVSTTTPPTRRKRPSTTSSRRSRASTRSCAARARRRELLKEPTDRDATGRACVSGPSRSPRLV